MFDKCDLYKSFLQSDHEYSHIVLIVMQKFQNAEVSEHGLSVNESVLSIQHSYM